MTWKAMQPESGAKSAQDEEGAQLQEQGDYAPSDPDPGHVRTRQHYEAMLEEQRAGQ